MNGTDSFEYGPPPGVFETYAGLVKFIAVQQTSPAFYEKHRGVIESACSFLRIAASEHPILEKCFRVSLPEVIDVAGAMVRAALREANLSDEQLAWFDAQSTSALRQLVTVVRDPELPDWMRDCRWAVLGAFESWMPSPSSSAL